MSLRRFLVCGLPVSAALLASGPAAADVGLMKVSPNAAAPNDPIEVTVGCGGQGCPTRLPVSLVPVSQAPRPHPCAHNAVCSPEANGPPRSAPFTFLGWAEEKGSPSAVNAYSLRTRVPRVRPGAYAFVIYLGAHEPGVLIADTSGPGRLLRVDREGSSEESEDSGANATWLIVAGVGVLAIAAVAVFRRRRA